MSPETFKKARALADKLTSSCAPNEHWEELEELTREECRALDTIAFECHVCGHWFPNSEKFDEDAAQWTCVDCWVEDAP